MKAESRQQPGKESAGEWETKQMQLENKDA